MAEGVIEPTSMKSQRIADEASPHQPSSYHRSPAGPRKKQRDNDGDGSVGDDFSEGQLIASRCDNPAVDLSGEENLQFGQTLLGSVFTTAESC